MKTPLVTWFLIGSTAIAQDMQVTVKVYPPRALPPTASVYITGNDSSLGNWNPSAVPLERSTDGAWVRTFKFPSRKRLEYKITRGGWNNQAIYQMGVVPGNHVLEITGDTTVVIRPVQWSDIGFKAEGKITGTVKYHRNLKGQGLANDRDLIVWLPPSYGRTKFRRYPVLYMHDGQNVFDPNTSFIGYDWQADEVADNLIRKKKMAEIIIVGIYNSADRIAEYSDTELGRAYAKFVVDSVKPLIDNRYRTLPDREHTAVMGSSMGGLISFLFVWWYPDVFSQAACLSSVFDRSRTEVLYDVESYKGLKKPIRVYMDCGGIGGDETLRPGMEEMQKLLKTKGYRQNEDYSAEFYPKADHSERSWSKRLSKPLLFLFGNEK